MGRLDLHVSKQADAIRYAFFASMGDQTDLDIGSGHAFPCLYMKAEYPKDNKSNIANKRFLVSLQSSFK